MLENAFEALKKLDWGSDPQELKQIDEAINASHGDSKTRAELEEQLLAVLDADVPRAAKDFVFRKLKVIGTATSVKALAPLLANKDFSHMARYALESMQVPAAGEALRSALSQLKGDLRAGVMGSLGVRKDDEAVGMLARLISDDDPGTAKAAVQALGAIRTPAAAKALAGTPNPAVKDAAADASFACAESLLRDGKKSEALAVYTRLAAGEQPKHIKLAATKGRLACAGRG